VTNADRRTPPDAEGGVLASLAAAFEADPSDRFTVGELAKAVFPGEKTTRWHLVTVRRTLRNLPGLNLHFCRTDKGRARGWRYVMGASDTCCF
jgi:hypothetical protein